MTSSALSSSNASTVDDDLEARVESLMMGPSGSRNMLRCVLNPVNVEEIRKLKRRHGLPPFDAIIDGAPGLVEPWTPQTLMAFLDMELNKEHLLFYEEVQWLRYFKGEVARAPVGDVLVLPGDTREDEMKWVEAMRAEFVAEDAVEPINVSHAHRAALLLRIDAAKESHKVDPAMFADTQAEVRKLLYQDAWPRFMARMLTTNVSDKEGSRRLRIVLACFAVCASIDGLVLGLMGSRWLMIIALPFWCMGMAQFLVYETNYCPMVAQNMQIVFRADLRAVTINCPVAKAMHRKARQRYLAFASLLGFCATAITIAISYIIEAGTGKSLYY